MKTVLVLAIFSVLLLLCALVFLLRKKRSLTKQIEEITKKDLWHKLAITDDLTGLYNRLAYSEYIGEIEKDGERGVWGIILFDVDNFKNINDTQGHLAGDNFLRLVSKTLLCVFSSVQYRVFRLGGDEFAVVSKAVSEERIIDDLLKFRKCLEKETSVKVSIGYALIYDSVSSAFENADCMLYADKASRKEKTL